MIELAAEVIVSNVFGFDTKVIPHFEDRLVHHRWATDVILDVFGCRMVFKVVLQQHLVDEALITGPVVRRKWFRQRDIELEVRKLFFDFTEVVDIEQFATRATAVPVRYFAVGLASFEQFKDMASQWCHSSTTPDVNHFCFGVLDKEFTVGTADCRLITWFQVKDVTTHLTGRRVFRSTWWRRSDTHVQHDNAFFARIVGHRIGAYDGLFDFRDITPNVEFVPVLVEPFVDIKIFVVDIRFGYSHPL